MISSFYWNTKILKPKWDGNGKKSPVVIEQYNKNILGVDKGDQLNIFTDNSRKSMRWFAWVGLELILGSCMSNTYILHKKNYLYYGTIIDFRNNIIKTQLKI